MSIPLSSIMAMFSFTKVKTWRTVNFLLKCPANCTKVRLKFQNFPVGDTLGPHPPLGASRLDWWPSATRSSP